MVKLILTILICFSSHCLVAQSDSTKNVIDFFELGKVKQREGNYSETRKFYFKALESDATLSDKVYSKIGDLYYNSWKRSLKEDGDYVSDKAAYMIAYDMYEKANDEIGMLRAKAQFPSLEHAIICFGPKNLEEIVLKVNCWIQGETKLRVREWFYFFRLKIIRFLF